jgi:drug/metabolite transporter (DMT)-like permease
MTSPVNILVSAAVGQPRTVRSAGLSTPSVACGARAGAAVAKFARETVIAPGRVCESQPLPSRRHRWITLPSGSLLFACLALPGYRDCGINHAMTSEPLLVMVCVLGVVVTLAALAPLRARAERWVAIASVVVSVLAAGVLSLACAGFDRVYAGVTLGLAASVSLAAAGVVWEREARGRDETARQYMRVLVPLIVAGIVIVAAASTWTPPPDQAPDVDLAVH